MDTLLQSKIKHSNRQANAAINFYEEYPALENFIKLENFIDGLIEPSNEFFSDMRLEGMPVTEAQLLTTKLYVIEPLYALVETHNIPMTDD